MKQSAFFQYIELEKRFSPHTVLAYQNDLGQFFSFLEEQYEAMPIDEVQHTQIRSWMVQMRQDGISPRSINRKLSCLKTYYKFLLKRELITKNPMQKVLSPKVGKVTVQ